MKYCSSSIRQTVLFRITAVVLCIGLLSATASAAVAVPQDVQVHVQTRNSSTNPGPFSAGSSAMFDARFRIDASVTPSAGAAATFTGALDDLVITVTDSVLGSFAIHGQDGRLLQLVIGGGTDTMSGGWGSFNGGSLLPLSVLNPSISNTAFQLESVSFEFRGTGFYDNPQSLPTSLSHAVAPGSSDFTFLDLTLRFTNDDPAVGSIPKTTIIRANAFDTISVSAVPEPGSMAMMLAGVLLVGAAVRRSR